MLQALRSRGYCISAQADQYKIKNSLRYRPYFARRPRLRTFPAVQYSPGACRIVYSKAGGLPPSEGARPALRGEHPRKGFV